MSENFNVQSTETSSDCFHRRLTTETSFSRYLTLVLFIALPFIGFLLGFHYAKTESAIQIVQLEDFSIPEAYSENSQPTTQEYKVTFLSGEIPFDWNELSESDNVVKVGDNPSLDNIRFSIAKGPISFEGGALEQVDFYYLEKGVKEIIMSSSAAEISEVILNGLPTTIIEYPLDNGEVTKNGTGGKDYIIEVPASNSSYPSHILVRKLTLGNEEFESNIEHYLNTADFSNIIDFQPLQ